MHGRRETLTIGRYGRTGISLAKAREKCLDACTPRWWRTGDSRPPIVKQREKRRLLEAKSWAFPRGVRCERWFKEAPMADSTRAMRPPFPIYDRDLLTGVHGATGC